MRGLSSAQIQAVGIVLVALLTVLAAFLKILIGLEAHEGWDWVGFFQDVVQFAVIAAIITVASTVISGWALRRQHEALIFRSLPIFFSAFYGPVTKVFRVSPSDTAKKKQEFLKTALGNILDFRTFAVSPGVTMSAVSCRFWGRRRG